MPCSGGWPVYGEFLLSCHAQSKRNMSCESIQEGTKCPSHALLSTGAFPGKAVFVLGMETEGLSHFTRVPSRNSARPRQSAEGTGALLRSGLKPPPPLLPWERHCLRGAHDPNAKALPFLSVQAHLPSQRAPREPPTPQRPSYFSIFLWGIFFSLMY